MDNELYSLLTLVTKDLSAETVLLAGLKGIIAAEITMKRHEKKMSQAEFAALMGVSQSLVSRWEQGDVNYTLETLVRIASKLDIEMQSPFKLVPPAYYVSVSSKAAHSSDSSSWNSVESSRGASSYEEKISSRKECYA